MITTAIKNVYNDTAYVLGTIVGSGIMAIILHTDEIKFLETIIASMMITTTIEYFRMKNRKEK
ncbi:hypothetical protein [Bacillus cereus group sp. TH152-1LC]|uniref:hypothetical protein n=1 Tax=Bacillus cereus group sp. TH152-1LC TaxID=3018060 RepID=UPI0022E31744|nr:hypothetical protein [Bacillus cereus group sp. TH152-1LC]MDA1675594.1 hypothetical protein [Bacillus cereus group sp. TH152-1LC]